MYINKMWHLNFNRNSADLSIFNQVEFDSESPIQKITLNTNLPHHSTTHAVTSEPCHVKFTPSAPLLSNNFPEPFSDFGAFYRFIFVCVDLIIKFTTFFIINIRKVCIYLIFVFMLLKAPVPYSILVRLAKFSTQIWFK